MKASYCHMSITWDVLPTYDITKSSGYANLDTKGIHAIFLCLSKTAQFYETWLAFLKRPENSSRPNPTDFLELKIFVRFQILREVQRSTLRNGLMARELSESFEKRTPVLLLT